MITGDQLEVGKYYRLVTSCGTSTKEGTSSRFVGAVLYIQKRKEGVSHAVPLYCPVEFSVVKGYNWWLYEDDLYEEVTNEEELTALRLAQ